MISFKEFSDYVEKNVPAIHQSDFPRGLLYHYTGPDGFMGIASSNTLRATHFGFMNDGSEIAYGYGVVLSAFQRLDQKLKIARLTRTLQELLQVMANEVGANPFFLFCMCEKNDLLSQWRGYGTDSTSYCLGFDVKEFVQGSFHPEPLLTKVIYNEAAQSALSDQFVQEVYNFALMHDDELEDDKVRADFLQQISAFAYNLYHRFKHPAFEVEHEWRLTLNMHRAGPDPKVEFRPSRLGVTPYRTIRAKAESSKLPIRELRIGPCSHPAEAFNAASSYLQSLGHNNCAVAVSGIPLRNT